MISLIISSIISIFIFGEFFASFVLGFISSYYFRLNIIKALVSISLFALIFETITFELKEFPLIKFYINFFISVMLGIVGYLIKDPLMFSSFFYISYVLKRSWRFIIAPILLLILYYFNLTQFERIFLFLTIFSFSIPFIAYNHNYYGKSNNEFDTLKFVNGIFLGYILLKSKLDFVVFSILYVFLSILPIYRIFNFLPSYFPSLFYYLIISVVLSSSIYFYNNTQDIALLKYPLFALGIIFIHILQIVIAFIPGHFVPFMAGYLFGLWGIVFDSIGMLFGSFTAYYIGKLLGEKVALRFVRKEDFEKFSKFVNEKGIFGFYFLYLIPFTPKDALCFVAGALKINWIYFLLLILFIRIPADILIVLLGAGFKNLDTKISIVFALLGFVFLLVYFITANLIKKKKR